MVNLTTIEDLKNYILENNKYFLNAFAPLYPITTEQGYALFNRDGDMQISSIYDDSLGNYFYIRTNGAPRLANESFNDCDNSYKTTHKYALIAFVDGNSDDVLFNLFHTINNYLNINITGYADNKSQIIYEECGSYFRDILTRIKPCLSVIRIEFEIIQSVGQVKDLKCLKEIKCNCCD